jgi:ABC-type amino acid transport substrate-binding protein
MVRKHLPLMLVAFLLLFLPNIKTAEAQFLQSPYFEKVKRGEPLIVALHKDTPPFCLVDENGIPHGIDVEIALLLGEALGADIEFVYPEFKNVITGVHEGDYDLAIANLTITTERSTKVAFSHSYMNIAQGVLLDRRFIPRTIVEGEVKDVPIKSFADIKTIPGLVLGTWGHTTTAERLSKNHPDLELRIFPNIVATRQALKDGEINAMVSDSPLIQFISNYFPGDRKRFKALTQSSAQERLAIAIHMGDPTFLDFLDGFVDELKANGTMDNLIEQYLKDTSWAGEVLR